MSEELQTIEPIAKKGLIKINKNENVAHRLKCGEKYVMYLPETDETICVICRGMAIRAADLQIVKHTKKGKNIINNLDCVLAYQYDMFDTICFSSFSYREKCELYEMDDVYELRETLDELM